MMLNILVSCLTTFSIVKSMQYPLGFAVYQPPSLQELRRIRDNQLDHARDQMSHTESQIIATFNAMDDSSHIIEKLSAYASNSEKFGGTVNWSTVTEAVIIKLEQQGQKSKDEIQSMSDEYVNGWRLRAINSVSEEDTKVQLRRYSVQEIKNESKQAIENLTQTYIAEAKRQFYLTAAKAAYAAKDVKEKWGEYWMNKAFNLPVKEGLGEMQTKREQKISGSELSAQELYQQAAKERCLAQKKKYDLEEQAQEDE